MAAKFGGDAADPGCIRRTTTLVLCAGAAALAAATAAVPGAQALAPDWRVVAREPVAPGLEHVTLHRDGPDQVVNVATVHPDAGLALRPVMTAPGTPAERTSALCQRVGCLLAVNGDFALPGSGWPVGGAVSGGELVRSPVASHHQLLLSPDGPPAAGTLDWSGTIVATDLKSLEIDGVNVHRAADSLIVFTPAAGVSTGQNEHGTELVAMVEAPASRLRVGTTSRVRVVERRAGQANAPIPPNGIVLSGHGAKAAALDELWARIEANTASPQLLVRFDTARPVQDSIGGTPILLREGKPWYHDADTQFVKGRHPRTAVGWRPDGTIVLVTIDGRQPGYGEGATLAELTDLMRELGATEALNLDGGGSTTFVRRGEVVNSPSDRLVRSGDDVRIVAAPPASAQILGTVERPVVNALAIVPEGAPFMAGDPLDGISPPAPAPLDLPVPLPSDPGSNPYSALPALVASTTTQATGPAAIAAILLVMTAAAAGHLRGRMAFARLLP